MKRSIYFFSGAGHSFAVARDIASRWEETQLYNMSSSFGESQVTDNSPVIGLVFPVYGGLPPAIIRKWLENFRPGKESVVFAVCTCGIAPGHTMLEVDKILKSSGSRLYWGFSVMQPQSGIGSKRINTPEKTEKLLLNQREKIDFIVRYIDENKPPCLEKSHRFSEFLNSKTLIALPTLIKLIYYLITKGMDNMKFHPGQKCNSCGICVRLCPVHNISMDNEKAEPLWEDNCIGCMACYHWCPEDAVRNVNLDMIQSPHKEVKVSELLNYN